MLLVEATSSEFQTGRWVLLRPPVAPASVHRAKEQVATRAEDSCVRCAKAF